MKIKISERDKRTLVLGGVASVLIVLSVYIPRGVGHWQQMRSEIRAMEATLKDIQSPASAKQMVLDQQVPVYRMPESPDNQAFLFRARLTEQIKKAGLKEVPLQMDVSKNKSLSGYQPLYLSYSGKCTFDKLLKLLVDLKTNPYYVSVEALKIDADPKQQAQQRRELAVELTVSTLTKKTTYLTKKTNS